MLLESGALLNATAFFAAVPFASLYLADETTLNTAAIGAVVGGIALSPAFGGVIGGMLVDRVGAARLIRIGLALYVVVYTLLATVRGTGAIVVLLLGLGVCRMVVEPGGKKLLSLVGGDDGRVFRVRYMTLCLGGILGPLIGGALFTLSPTLFFAVPAVLYLAYLVLFTARRRALGRLERAAAFAGGRFAVRAALRDRRLLAAAGAGLAVFFVFSQLESMIPLYLREHHGERASTYFAAAFVTNGVLALAFQIPIDRVQQRVGHRWLVAAGCLSFSAAFACYWASAGAVGWLFAGIVLWTVGEGILLPMPDMAVNAIADDRRKATYFGLADIRYLGFFLGPVAGGFLLGEAGAVYFAVMGVAVFACAPLLVRRYAAPTGPAEADRDRWDGSADPGGGFR